MAFYLHKLCRFFYAKLQKEDRNKIYNNADIFLQKGECYAKGHKTRNKRLLLEITGESAIIHLDRMIESQGV